MPQQPKLEIRHGKTSDVVAVTTIRTFEANTPETTHIPVPKSVVRQPSLYYILLIDTDGFRFNLGTVDKFPIHGGMSVEVTVIPR